MFRVENFYNLYCNNHFNRGIAIGLGISEKDLFDIIDVLDWLESVIVKEPKWQTRR